MNVRVEGAFRIDDDQGPLFAESLTAGLDDLYFLVKAVCFEFFFKLRDYFF